MHHNFKYLSELTVFCRRTTEDCHNTLRSYLETQKFNKPQHQRTSLEATQTSLALDTILQIPALWKYLLYYTKPSLKHSLDIAMDWTATLPRGFKPTRNSLSPDFKGLQPMKTPTNSPIKQESGTHNQGSELCIISIASLHFVPHYMKTFIKVSRIDAHITESTYKEAWSTQEIL